MRIIKVLIPAACALGLAFWIWRGVEADAYVLPWPGEGVASGRLHLYGDAWTCFTVALVLGIAMNVRTAWRLGQSAVGRAHIEGLDWILGCLMVAAVAASLYLGLGS